MFAAESGEYQRVVAFLKGIPQDVLAKASLRSKAYTRALMHFEAHILENKEDIQDHLTFLQVRPQDEKSQRRLRGPHFSTCPIKTSSLALRLAAADAVRCDARA